MMTRKNWVDLFQIMIYNEGGYSPGQATRIANLVVVLAEELDVHPEGVLGDVMTRRKEMLRGNYKAFGE